MLKVWISGANGHLGQALCTRLDREKYQLIATDVAEVDVTVPAEVRAFADANRPDVIINCTGFNDEDGCETDPDRAYRVNALAPRNLALAADALGAKMVQFSTDDVFAKASHHPYNEFDAPAPESLYGKKQACGRRVCAHAVPPLPDRAQRLGVRHRAGFCLHRAERRRRPHLPLAGRSHGSLCLPYLGR